MQIMRTPLLAVSGIVLAGGLALGLAGCGTEAVSPRGTAASQGAVHVLAAGNVTNDDTTILARADVGSAVFLLGQRGDEIRFAASFDGSNPNSAWERITTKPVAADDITVLSAGNSADRYATVVGQVGADVQGIDVRTHDGRTVSASISNGYYIAAWEGSDFTDRDHLDQTVTVHLLDGSTKTATYLQSTEE